MTVYGYTEHYNLELPSFDYPNWHLYYYRNLRTIDGLLYMLSGVGSIRGIWAYSTVYDVNDRVVDPDVGEIYVCQVLHTTPTSGTFAEHRAANPTYWELFDFGEGGGGGGGTAATTTFTPAGTLAATNVQAAIEELADEKADTVHNHDTAYAPITHAHAIADVTSLQTALDGKAFWLTPLPTTPATTWLAYYAPSSPASGLQFTNLSASFVILSNKIYHYDTIVLDISRDETTALTTGTLKYAFSLPYECRVLGPPYATLNTASTSGNVVVDINVNGTTIMPSNKLSIDVSEKTSGTAATTAQFSGTTALIAANAEISFDIDSAGTGAKGLKVVLQVRRNT